MRGVWRMIVTAWSNGNPNNVTGSGYGIRIKKIDRDRYFSKSNPEIIIRISNGPVINAPLSKSFWRKCSEIRHKEIGKWILHNINKGECRWEKGKPPVFLLEPLSGTEYKLSIARL